MNTDWMTTSTILAGLRDFEDRDAWDRLAERFRPPIVAFAVRVGLARGDAEDVAQESLLAFATAYREGRYDPAKGRLSGWLFGIAYRQALSARRKRADEEDLPGDVDGLEDERAATVTWDREWEQSILTTCMEQVRRESSEATFRAFELSVHSGLPAAEVARELDVPVKAVYNAKHRVLSRLRELRARMEDTT